jgi:hypothetical protein
MINKVLVVGFACLSVVAVAQSNGNTDQPSNAKIESPRDAASGQASGKRMHKPVTVQSDATARELSTGKATGKTMASDDRQASASKKNDSSNGQGEKRVATGDVNGDGKADVSASKNSGHAIEQNAVTNPRDIATGQASGKRQYRPVSTTTQDSNAASKKDKK